MASYQAGSSAGRWLAAGPAPPSLWPPERSRRRSHELLAGVRPRPHVPHRVHRDAHHILHGWQVKLLADGFELLVHRVEHITVVDELGAALHLHGHLALGIVDAHRHPGVALQVLTRLAAEHVGEVEVLVVEQGAAALDGHIGHAGRPDRGDPHVVTAGEQVVELLGDTGHGHTSGLSFALTLPIVRGAATLASRRVVAEPSPPTRVPRRVRLAVTRGARSGNLLLRLV